MQCIESKSVMSFSKLCVCVCVCVGGGITLAEEQYFKLELRKVHKALLSPRNNSEAK